MVFAIVCGFDFDFDCVKSYSCHTHLPILTSSDKFYSKYTKLMKPKLTNRNKGQRTEEYDQTKHEVENHFTIKYLNKPYIM